jgi:cobalt-zinc-cadmium efflux system protein
MKNTTPKFKLKRELRKYREHMGKHHHHHCDHDHDHDHEHDRGHHHHHHHAPRSDYGRAFLFGILLNAGFVVIEGAYGFFTHSLALVADAGHNLSDVAGLIMAWGAFWLSRKKPNQYFTFGLRKSSILSALFNSLLLMIAVGMILWEAISRFKNPNPINSQSVMIVAGIGIFVNGLTALLFFKDKDHDLNLKGAYLHMAADALVSVGVVFSALIISKTSWFWIDPLMSVIISLVIVHGTWSLLRDSLKLSMDAVPENIDLLKVKEYFESIDEVSDVHDLHIWAISTTETALTVHLTLKDGIINNELITKISIDLKNKFQIHHPTIQTEKLDENFHCELKPEDVL